MNRQGSALLLAMIVSCLLAAGVLSATGAFIHHAKATRHLEESLRLLYAADAGLAVAEAACREHGTGSSAGNPFGRWIRFERAAFFLRPYVLTPGEPATPYLVRDSGLLVLSTGSVGAGTGKRLCLLLDAPPSCRRLAWWEPR